MSSPQEEQQQQQQDRQVIYNNNNQNDDDENTDNINNNNQNEQNEVSSAPLEAQDKVLYEEVLSYLMKGHRMTDSGDGTNAVNHMPRSVEKALSNRHVKVNDEPTDIVPGPIQFVDLPLGLALLFDVATDELFVERWQDRLLDEFPPPEKLDLNKENEKAAGAAAAASAGEDASSGNNSSGKKDADGEGSPEGKKKDSADGEENKKDDEGEKKEDKKKDDDEEDKDDDNEDDGEDRSNSKKKRRIVIKDPWGGVKEKKKAPQKKYSTLVKPEPLSRGLEYIYTTDINAELQLVGAPEWIPYLSYLVSLPPPRDDRCTQLFEYGTNLAQEIEKRVKAEKEKKAEEELKNCTFQPTVSESAKRLPGWKGDMEKFHHDKLEWVKQMQRKLAKKKEKEERERQELYEQWKMGEKSKKILEQRERRLRDMGLESGETPARAADRRGVEVTPDSKKAGPGGANNKTGFRKSVAAPEYSFKPVTNTNRHRSIQLAAAMANQSGSVDENGNEKHYDFTSILDGFRLDDNLARREDEDERDFLARMDEDYAGREERRKQRAIQFARQQKEKLFDPVTGQPLFEPNSAPTVVRQDGTRVSFYDLSPKEKKDLLRKLKQQKRLDFVPGVARDKSDGHRMGEDEMSEMYKRMLEKVRQGTIRIDRIKRKEDQERKKWFRPTIEPKSTSILKVSGKMRKPVHRMPLKRKPSPPPPKPQPKSVASKMKNVVERNDGFINSRRDAIEKKLEEKKSKEETYTYTPKVSKASTRLVNERREHFFSQIEQMEEQRREYYASRSAEIHYACDMAGGGPLRANNVLYRASQSPTNNNNNNNEQQPRQLKSGSPNNNNNGISRNNNNINNNSHGSPVIDAFYSAREQGWNRPDARKPASHYYTDPPIRMTRERQQELQREQLIQQRQFLSHGGHFGDEDQITLNLKKEQQQQLNQTQYHGGSEQQQQQLNPQDGGDDIDSIVGSMLSNSAKRRGDTSSLSASSPQPQLQQNNSNNNNNVPNNYAYAQPQFKQPQNSASQPTTSSPSRSQPQQASRSMVGAAALSTDEESGSGRRLKNILASWDELEKQAASVL